MNCPSCHHSINKLSNKCPDCGFEFPPDMHGKLSLFFEMKEDMASLKALEQEFYAGVNKVAKKIEEYGDSLTGDLHQMQPALHPGKAAEPKDDKSELKTSVQKAMISEQKTTTPKSSVNANLNANKPELNPPAEKKPFDFELLFGMKSLLIIGIIATVFGVGFFLKYSFDQGWVGPAGRVALAYLWGIGFLILGNHFKKKKYLAFGLAIFGGGIAVLYFSTYAAFQIYNLFDQSLSFFIMILITALACLMAVIYENQWLAILGLIGGFITPMLLSTGHDNQLALMTYMTLLNLGLLAVAFFKKWNRLNILGFLFTYILFIGWVDKYYTQEKFWPTIIFLNIFFLLYSVIPFIYHFIRSDTKSVKGFLIIFANSGLAFAISYYLINSRFSLEWVSLVAVFYSLVFLLLANILHKREKYSQEAFTVLLFKSSLFLIITVPLLFSKHWITIFWAAQALILFYMGKKLARKNLVTVSYLLITIDIFKFLYYDLSNVFYFRLNLDKSYIRDSFDFIIAERYLTYFLLLAVVFLLARKTGADARSAPGGIAGLIKQMSALFYTILGGLLFFILTIETSAFCHDNLPLARFAAISILWTLTAIILMLMGFRFNNVSLRKVSLALFLVAIIKVFFFDIANISTPFRILSFIILGIILIGASYLYHKFKQKLLPAPEMERKGD